MSFVEVNLLNHCGLRGKWKSNISRDTCRLTTTLVTPRDEIARINEQRSLVIPITHVMIRIV